MAGRSRQAAAQSLDTLLQRVQRTGGGGPAREDVNTRVGGRATRGLYTKARRWTRRVYKRQSRRSAGVIATMGGVRPRELGKHPSPSRSYAFV